MAFLQARPGCLLGGAASRGCRVCTLYTLCTRGGGTCIAIPADLQELSEVERLVEEVSKREKRLHVLVNNAGAAWGDPIDTYPVGSSFFLSFYVSFSFSRFLVLLVLVLLRSWFCFWSLI